MSGLVSVERTSVHQATVQQQWYTTLLERRCARMAENDADAASPGVGEKLKIHFCGPQHSQLVHDLLSEKYGHVVDARSVGLEAFMMVPGPEPLDEIRTRCKQPGDWDPSKWRPVAFKLCADFASQTHLPML